MYGENTITLIVITINSIVFTHIMYLMVFHQFTSHFNVNSTGLCSLSEEKKKISNKFRPAATIHFIVSKLLALEV